MNKLNKNTLFFSLDAVLFNAINKEKKKKIFELFDKLNFLLESNELQLIFISGLEEKNLRERFSLDFFEKLSKAKFFFVSKEYIESKAEIEKQAYFNALAKDPFFRDDYFKQLLMQEFIQKNNIQKEKAVFVCHDILTEAYYSLLFSNIDFVLIKNALTFRNQKIDALIDGINFINLNWHDMKKVLLGKLPKQNTKALESFVLNRLKKELFPDLNKMLSTKLSEVKK
jgi:hypothetical protein